jgi:hypothetical protein
VPAKRTCNASVESACAWHEKPWQKSKHPFHPIPQNEKGTTMRVKPLNEDKWLKEMLSGEGAIVHLTGSRGGTIFFNKDRFVRAKRITVTEVELRDKRMTLLVKETPSEIEKQLKAMT